MKFSEQIAQAFVAASLFFGANTVNGAAIARNSSDIDPELYKTLFAMCEADPGAYVGVRYQDAYYTNFHYGECYPYEIDGKLAEMAVFCRSATCYDNPNPDCTGGVVPPVGIPLVEGLTLINILDWVQLLGQGATCQENGLSSVSI